MTSSSVFRAAAAAFVLVALVGGAAALQFERERRFSLADAREELLYVTSPAMLERLALSYDAVLADIYWIRAIQYYGGTRLAPDDARKDYALLYPLLDVTTSLDPRFSIAYRFGAFFLSEQKPGGAGRPDLAIRLLQKALAQNPQRWEYAHDLGFVYYRGGDYKTAASWFLKAGEMPDAATWLKPLAAVILAGSGDTASSRVLWRNLLNSEADWIRRSAEHRLLQLDAIDAIALLERVTADFTRRFGRPASSWQDMMRAGMLRGVPTDPTGIPFVLDPSSGEVTVSNQSSLWPLPTDAPA